MTRCFGNRQDQALYANYHDTEWGVPSYDDNHLFEMLILEGAQAGLNWETILKRREGYKKSFHNFCPIKVAAMSDEELENLMTDSGIIRNKRKIFSARDNARAFLQIQKKHGSFSKYLWGFFPNVPLKNHFSSLEEVPASTTMSESLSKDLKKWGMSFVGPTIIYAYMQAVGLVCDHITSCISYKS